MAPWRHSYKQSAALNNRYVELLINDNHVENNLQEILVSVYYDSIVTIYPNTT